MQKLVTVKWPGCTALLLCLLCTGAFAQQCIISGYVLNNASRPVPGANIIISCQKDSLRTTGFAFTDSAGFFSLRCQQQWHDCGIDVSAIGYKPQKKITSIVPGHPLQVVLEAAFKPLEEVKVLSAVPVKQKGDTITFNAASFSSKNETTVEALVKKMPGFDVDDHGNMKYNGRPIERVLLDGDDLFGKDFKLLTKNLSPDALDKLQVIDNYSTNSAMAGLGKTDKQVLNLKLKKNALSTSAGITMGGGMPGGRYDGRLNVLTVTRKLKMLGLGALNNNGTELFSAAGAEKNDFQQKPGAMQELAVVRNQPLTQMTELQYRGIDARRTYLNRARMGSTHFFVRPSAAWSLKGHVFLIADRVSQEQHSITTYFSGQQPVLVRERAGLVKKDQWLSAGLEAEYRPSAGIQWLYRGDMDICSTVHQSVLQLQNNFLQPELSTRQHNTTHRLQYSHRITENQALHAELLYHRGRLPQNLTTSPVLYKDFLGIATTENGPLEQVSQFPVQQLLGVLRLVGKKNNTLYNVSAGGMHAARDFVSDIYQYQAGNGLILLQKAGFGGEYRSLNSLGYAEASLNRAVGRFTISAASVLNVEYFSLADTRKAETLLNTSFVYTQHKLNLTHKTGDNGRFSIQYAYKNRLPVLANLMPHYWLSTYRSFEKGIPRFKRVADNSVSVNYSFADFYRRQLLLFAGFVYNTNPFAYNRNLMPLLNYDIINHIVLPSGNEGLLGFARAEKYIHPLKGNLLVDFNSYHSSYLNQVAGLEANTRFSVTTAKFSYKSAWRGWLNILTIATARLNNQQVNIAERGNRLRNHVYEVRGQANIMPAAAMVSFEMAATHYSIPSGLGRNSFLFADFNLQYILKKDKLVCNLLGNNLLNLNSLSFENISALQASTQAFNLMPRYFMLRLYYKF